MDENLKKEYEARAQKVRADLKQWEADWAKTHGGKKPGREDIKNTPIIGAFTARQSLGINCPR